MKKISMLIFTLFLFIILVGCSKKVDNEYKDDSLWAFKENAREEKVDTFFLAPTCTSGSEESPTLSYDSEKNKSKFLGSIKMEKGIYDEKTRFFAPYYHQALLYAYTLDVDKREVYLESAYKDVKNAFDYYLSNYNNGNKIVLAGFSQGADMCLRLLKDYVNNNSFYDNFIACYAIGWKVDDAYLSNSNKLKCAEEEKDQKVIISYNTEDPNVTKSLVVGEEEYTYSINPLSWSTNKDEVDKSYNKGAVFLNTYGEVTKTIDNYTGCYIDSKRGTLKVTDVNIEDYPSSNPIFETGVYHLYDYQFFYNNLKKNVINRIGQ